MGLMVFLYMPSKMRMCGSVDVQMFEWVNSGEMLQRLTADAEVNGLTRLGTTNDGSTEHGAATLCRRVAVYSGPFRRHEMMSSR